jgi:GNAT superfamily N-acetyltransferase
MWRKKLKKYKVCFPMWYKFAQSQDDIQKLVDFFLEKYPGLVLRINEYENKIKLDKISVPVALRNQGIGTEIINVLKEYSQRVGKPIVLNPEPEKGKKGALQRFYERNEFVDNAGRKKDYDLTDTFSRTMYYKPK